MTAPRQRWIGLAVSLSVCASLVSCATNKSLQRARSADELREVDVAVAEYTKAVREAPNNREAIQGLQRAKLRASEEHLMRGRRLYAQGHYDDALIELQIAVELNPTNADADRDLHAVNAAVRAKLAAPEGGQTALQSLLQATRDLPPAANALPDVKLGSIVTGRQATTRDLYQTIATLGKVNITFDSAFRDAAAQPVQLANLSIKEAFDVVARATNTFYRVIGPQTIIVVNETPAKLREYSETVARPFYIQNADLKEVMDALRVVVDIRTLSPITATNAIVVTDTPDRVQAAGRLIAAFDKRPAEIVVDVEVLEVNRSMLQEYGLQIASPGSPGIDGSVDINRPNMTLDSLRKLGPADVFLTGLPALYYRLIRTDANTRTLANPHLRIQDGIAATANFGEDVPIPNSRTVPISQGGVDIQPQTQFTYRKVGVNLGMTPRIHPSDEVTLRLNIELSALAGTGIDGLPIIGQRTVTTQIRLKDGETNILAGLIREDERVEKQSLPGLGKVPVLGSLFAKNHKEAQQTDVVIMLTPHIIRVLDISADDLRPLRMPREGTGAALIEGAPIVPPPPIIRSGGGGQ
jgi:general secretion pathway protein D